VGRVGAGKTTLLTGLIGETKKTQGGVVRFGGDLAYGALFGHCYTASIQL
jgi:ABC-type multidrug transport system ATPase subunit